MIDWIQVFVIIGVFVAFFIYVLNHIDTKFDQFDNKLNQLETKLEAKIESLQKDNSKLFAKLNNIEGQII